MLLEHLGELDAAKRVMQAVEAVTADKSLHTGDLGGTATTAQVTAAVCAFIERAVRPAANAACQAPHKPHRATVRASRAHPRTTAAFDGCRAPSHPAALAAGHRSSLQRRRQ